MSKSAAAGQTQTQSQKIDELDQILQSLRGAFASKKEAERQIYELLDTAIPMAIDRCVQTKNCTPMQKLIQTLRGCDEKFYHRFLKDFLAYCVARDGLHMQEHTIFYVKAVNLLSCQPPLLEAWRKSVSNVSDLCKFSSWLEMQKEAAKKETSPREETKKALLQVAKKIESFGLQHTNAEVDQLLRNIKSVLESL